MQLHDTTDDTQIIPRMHRSHSRAIGIIVAIITCVLVLTGCARQPEFSPPIKWSRSSLIHADRVESIEPKFTLPKHMSIELRDDGTGTVENFPQGTLGLTDDERVCLRVSDEGVYSGEIAWKVRTEYTLTITFGDTELVLSGATGRFGAQDWIEVRIKPCDVGPAYWRMVVEYGEYAPGETKSPNAAAPA